MNYDGLLSQSTDEKLSLLQQAGIIVEEGAIEEEQAAQIQIQRNSPLLNNEQNSTASNSTPQRKISTSSRFLNAFQQFYTNTTAAAMPTATPTNSVSYDESDSGITRTKGMESKLLSMWHNMKYGWSGKMRSSFSKEQPVWLLGRCYHRKSTPPTSMENSTELVLSTSATCSVPAPTNPQEMVEEIVVPQEFGTDCALDSLADQPWEEGIEGFRRDFYTRIWMTYRREFPIMNGTNYTSDCGWGCMLRSGQMLLAQGLLCHFLGRSWRYDPDTQIHATYEDTLHKKIIKWFGDSSSKSSPFSIHSLVRLGEQMGKKPGDWYGPASVSFILKQALKNASQENADFDNLTIYVARDCTIYLQDVEETCQIPEPTSKPNLVPWQSSQSKSGTQQQRITTKSQQWKSLIILIPLRLGAEKLNQIYAHCLKLLLSTEYCIGIIGGRPKHALYFVGFQDDKLIHLDPHYCQEMVDVNQENFPLNSFHCKSPRKLKTSKMDPSCCIGFYCHTKADFDGFVESVQLYLNPMRCASGTVDRVIPASQQMPSSSTTKNSSDETTASYAEMNYPLFSFSRGHCLDDQRDEMSDSLYKPAALRQISQLSNTSAFCNLEDEDSETEEFVLL